MYHNPDLIISTLYKPESKHLKALVLPCLIKSNDNCINSCVFVDSGGNGIGFIDSNFVQKHSLSTSYLTSPRVLRVVDGRKSLAGLITHTARIKIEINNHSEVLEAFVTKLGQYPIILGHEWLALHNPSINWATNSLRFESHYCQTHYQITPGHLPRTFPQNLLRLLQPPVMNKIVH